MLKICLRVHTVEKSKLTGVHNQLSIFSLHCYYTHTHTHTQTHAQTRKHAHMHNKKKAEIYNISYIRPRRVVIGQYSTDSNETMFDAV